MAREYNAMEVLSDQYLLSKNQIYLFGVIDTAMAARVIPQMHYIEQKMIDDFSRREIYIERYFDLYLFVHCVRSEFSSLFFSGNCYGR